MRPDNRNQRRHDQLMARMVGQRNQDSFLEFIIGRACGQRQELIERYPHIAVRRFCYFCCPGITGTRFGNDCHRPGS